MCEKDEPPAPVSLRKSRLSPRALLGNYLYRRVALWVLLVCLILSALLLKTDVRSKTAKVVGFGGFPGTAPPSPQPPPQGSSPHQKQLDAQRLKKLEQQVKEENKPHWIIYKHLNGYFSGLKSLVSIEDHVPEWPSPDHYTGPVTVVPQSNNSIPTPEPYRPYPDYHSEEYLAKHPPVVECHLDEHGTPVPDIHAFPGVPQPHPDPALGDHKILGIRNDVCFDRFGRYGPYGLGYGTEEGGTGQGMDTEHTGAEAVWADTGKIDYRRVDWGGAQERCVARNAQRFVDTTDTDGGNGKEDQNGIRKIEQRQAVIVRTYVGYRWTPHAILNLRAIISELSLKTGGEYSVHFLLHVKDRNAPIWADRSVVQRILDENVPQEFHSLCTVWSEDQMRLYYPGDFGETFRTPSSQPVHGVYRSAHMPMQVFALQHPEYAHIWNWELDMRYTGSFYELFDRIRSWARDQPRRLLWERSAKYYIPALHGSWEQFSDLVANETEASGRPPIMGPVDFPGRKPLFSETPAHRKSVVPPSCDDDQPPETCGVGEEADIITFNPLFDAESSGWVFSEDVTGYDTHLRIPPRRCAIITASRLSRRLLLAMHEETWRHHHSMFTEMFPATMALHHGLKGVYAPHPVFLDRGWDLGAIERSFNGGRDGSSGGPGSPFDIRNEHNHKGATWYFNAEFSGLLWRRWLGYAQMDGRGDDGGRAGEGELRGGQREEESELSSGRMCLRSMLLHPIKYDNPADKA
ncbi:hypothetical protein SODALDRAFT_322393 [Sodiomyces alkalinus F11]|uniref:Major facilitator superfamily transporter n=1 Tax=Sodiomyces alkalinus (strain CBS 110278 / VKM F-3762 / F11) TaxID=1314773 RepID=A0A3N2Q3G2_SODAK|nr:hypothetical protein SODALDRAFT_322393 [Sodiomyces alkalinus F11]ROT41208.1 hypothetical protein SODALDRAFT_322393 [Sodiomyces alkalinus F11]